MTLIVLHLSELWGHDCQKTKINEYINECIASNLVFIANAIKDFTCQHAWIPMLYQKETCHDQIEIRKTSFFVFFCVITLIDKMSFPNLIKIIQGINDTENPQ